MLFYSTDGIHGWLIILKRISHLSLQPCSFTPPGFSTYFEAVKSSPTWLVHRCHFHNTCCSSQISLLNLRARGYQNCQLHTISPHLLLNCWQKTKNFDMSVYGWLNYIVEGLYLKFNIINIVLFLFFYFVQLGQLLLLNNNIRPVVQFKRYLLEMTLLVKQETNNCCALLALNNWNSKQFIFQCIFFGSTRAVSGDANEWECQ